MVHLFCQCDPYAQIQHRVPEAQNSRERELTTDDRGDQEVTRLSVSCVCVKISQKLMFVKGNKVNKQCSNMLLRYIYVI